MAREIVALSPEKLEILEFEDPVPQANQVLIVAEHGAAKHGTEMAGIKGYGERGRFDSELRLHLNDDPTPSPETSSGKGKRVGNMIVGIVREVGSEVTSFRVGERIAAHSPFRDLTAAAEDKCRRLEQGVTWQDAVCLDPAEFALAAVRDGQVRIRDAVAVFGLGAIGLMVIQIAKLSGAHPILGIDPLANRREAAKACGADAVIDPISDDAGLLLKKKTANRGVDVAIDYSGSVHAMQAALRGVAFGGNVVAGAFPPPYGAGLDLGAEAHMNRPNIIFTRACSEPNRDHPRWDEGRICDTCWRLFKEGKLSGEPIVSPIVPFEEIVNEYPKIMSDPGSNIKLGCNFA